MTLWLGLEEDDRCAIFIDGANLYKTARNLGFDIDYKKLLKKTREESRLIRASYYTAIQEDRDQDYSPLRPLVDWLDYNGYHMVTKIAREYTDNHGNRRIKGSIDVEMVIDMMELAPKLDAAILFSGNGDFNTAVATLQRKGIKVTVISTVKTSPAMVSDEIRRQADFFIDLADLQKEIGRKEAPKKQDIYDEEDEDYLDELD
ncbi:MAG: LabA-like NYN domain-containing protein [bacterium]